MNRGVFIFIFFSFLLILTCKRQDTTTVNGNSGVVLSEKNLQGIYKATIPGEDDTIIEELTLKDDKTYSLSIVFIKNKEEFKEMGTYQVEEGMVRLQHHKHSKEAFHQDVSPHLYKIEKHGLRQYNSDGEPVLGDLAEMYVLKKE